MTPHGPIGVAILGATGSVGRSTLDVIARHPERFRLVAATAHRDVDGMAQIVADFAPDFVAMCDPEAAGLLADQVDIEVLSGADGLHAAATCADAQQVMAAIVGGAGLEPTLAAAQAGKRVLLANKEALVMAGALFIDAVQAGGAELLPIDSEHNAIFQCLPAGTRCGQPVAGIESIVLTGSGGPFLHTPASQLAGVTPDQAVAHPNWSMGRKISVDSATLMNKGLEFIEAAWLFGLPSARIEVVIHPQSVVHSMVRMADGSVLAQLGQPDMRTPIAHCMGLPDRLAAGVEPLDFLALGGLEFCAPDRARFPCLALAEAALDAGAAASIALNAANEIAVAAFLEDAVGFADIPVVIEQTMAAVAAQAAAPDTIEAVLELDTEARSRAAAVVRGRSRSAGNESAAARSEPAC